MRHSYTPIFRDILTSRVWAMSPPARSVWLWMQLMADPEGFVCADVIGVALGANVPYAAARTALEQLIEPDPDADQPIGIIERVPGGWRVIGFEDQRDLAKRQAHNARQRRYTKRTERTKPTEADASDAFVPHPNPNPNPNQISSYSEVVVDLPEPTPTPTDSGYSEGLRKVIHSMPADWAPSEALRAQAAMVGVADLDGHIARLRTGPIGGQRGIFEHEIDHYIGNMLGKMRSWEETDRAKRQPGKTDTAAPTSPKAQGARLPDWVREEHEELARGLGEQLKKLAKKFSVEHHIPPQLLHSNDAATAFTHYLERLEAGTGEAA